ncbi:hypothetical protein JTE90_002657 [Oedothorax gibbosus]|uniref:Uncharacterized protein n=1 Tax=Oedothorax gibbosus TaxID=931172 RepID=A0AAV6UDU6_9ARAC|nr:hypothetical protein JTE90_002657 [Oedothorax gibbosus]
MFIFDETAKLNQKLQELLRNIPESISEIESKLIASPERYPSLSSIPKTGKSRSHATTTYTEILKRTGKGGKGAPEKWERTPVLVYRSLMCDVRAHIKSPTCINTWPPSIVAWAAERLVQCSNPFLSAFYMVP